MKWTARDMLEILRLFGVASSENVPRNIEHFSTLRPDDVSTIFSFDFMKRHYEVIADPELDDDETLIVAAAKVHDPNREYEVVESADDEQAEYATRHHSKIIYLVREKRTSKRLDTYLAELHSELSRSAWQKHIKAGHVIVNAVTVTSPKHEVEPSDVVTLTNMDRGDFSGQTLPILHEDDDVVVVNKPSGVLTHSKGVLNDEFTVADFFALRSEVARGTNRPGIIHRLDRDTSGVILGAKTEAAAKSLKKQFSERTVKKTYLAVLDRIPEQPKGLIDIPIGRNPSAPSTFRVDPGGKPAQTYYEVLATNQAGQALVKFQPRTGRTHQLRVHANFLKTPIIGDRVYGKEQDRLMLHAYQLEVTLPGGKREVFTAELPSEFTTDFPGISL